MAERLVEYAALAVLFGPGYRHGVALIERVSQDINARVVVEDILLVLDDKILSDPGHNGVFGIFDADLVLA